ncbi:MAG: DUF5723 family protein, partial [Bacteroidia bacterium]
MKKLVLILVLLTSQLGFLAQDFHGFQSSNYSGVLGVVSNPANVVDNRMKFDLILGGVSVIADNNYLGVKRSAFNNPNPSMFGLIKESIKSAKDSTYIPKLGNWDTTRRESPYYWKNNFVAQDNSKDKSIYSALRATLPSFLVTINKKNAIAFNWGVRNYVNVDGISPNLARLAFEEFLYPSLWVTKLQNKNLSIQQMAWAEYGLTYGRVLKDDNEHFLKAGVTAKLLQGLSAAYVYIKDLNYEFTTDDTLSLFSSEVHYGHSTNFEIEPDGFKYKFVSNPGFGFDLGMVYEFRPGYEAEKYEMDGEKGIWRKDHNKYKFKASFAINDIGGIRFQKGALSNDFIADVRLWDLNTVNPNSVQGFDSLMTNMFGSLESQTTFKMALPTSINMQGDYHIWKTFYANLMINFSNLQKRRDAKVHDFTTISLAPRFDHKWFGLTVPLTYNTMTAKRGQGMNLGVMARLGPLMLGT